MVGDRSVALGVRAMKANEMEPWTRDEPGQALQEFPQCHHDMGGPIVVRRFELEDDLAGTGAGKPFVGNGRASDVATEVFECAVLMGTG
jgi:hypothetical protein